MLFDFKLKLGEPEGTTDLLKTYSVCFIASDDVYYRIELMFLKINCSASNLMTKVPLLLSLRKKYGEGKGWYSASRTTLFGKVRQAANESSITWENETVIAKYDDEFKHNYTKKKYSTIGDRWANEAYRHNMFMELKSDSLHSVIKNYIDACEKQKQNRVKQKRRSFTECIVAYFKLFSPSEMTGFFSFSHQSPRCREGHNQNPEKSCKYQSESNHNRGEMIILAV